MKTWNDWSNLDVNRRVAEVLGKKVVQHSMMFEGKVWVIEGWDGGIYKIPDYCNSWEEIGKIIVENGLSLEPYNYQNKAWLASTAFSIDVFCDKSPLRAVAIVFLMMNGVEENGE